MKLDLLEKISLSDTCETSSFSESFTVNELVPSEAKHPWIIKLYNVAEPKTDPHYHNIKTQTFVFLEGQTTLHLGKTQELIRAGQIAMIPPLLSHVLEQSAPTRFLVIDWPNLDYPKDHYENIEEAPNTNPAFISSLPVRESFLNQSCSVFPDSPGLQDLPSSAYKKRLDFPTHTVYEMCADPDHKWSLAIIDIKDVIPHYHKNGTEHFIVLNGQVEIKLEGEIQTLIPGQSAHIAPGHIHHLKSSKTRTARVLCVNFPAFDPSNFNLTK